MCRPPRGVQLGNHVFGDLTLVEGIAATGGDLLQGLGQKRLAMDRAGRRGLTIDQHILGACRIGGQSFHFIHPVIGHARMHDIALFGELDGGLENLGEAF